MIKIRPYDPQDCSKIIELFYNTVHSINAVDYTEEQLNAWAPKDLNIDNWQKSLSANFTIVAEIDNKIVGFGDITVTGYLDLLYVHKDFQGQGIASLILSELENYACNHQIRVITTESSITAKPFFEKQGYEILQEQQVQRNDQLLTNFRMAKNLGK